MTMVTLMFMAIRKHTKPGTDSQCVCTQQMLDECLALTIYFRTSASYYQCHVPSRGGLD